MLIAYKTYVITLSLSPTTCPHGEGDTPHAITMSTAVPDRAAGMLDGFQGERVSWRIVPSRCHSPSLVGW